eukprot:2861726-Pleurochrysis_carterae.AAC.5
MQKHTYAAKRRVLEARAAAQRVPWALCLRGRTRGKAAAPFGGRSKHRLQPHELPQALASRQAERARLLQPPQQPAVHATLRLGELRTRCRESRLAPWRAWAGRPPLAFLHTAAHAAVRCQLASAVDSTLPSGHSCTARAGWRHQFAPHHTPQKAQNAAYL